MSAKIYERLELFFSFPLLVYCIELVYRISSGGHGRLGGDTIELAYVLSIASIVTGGTAFVITKFQRLTMSKLTILGHITTLLSALIWFPLHLSGLVYSHGSLFR